MLDALNELGIVNNTIVVFPATMGRRSWNLGAAIPASSTVPISPAWRLSQNAVLRVLSGRVPAAKQSNEIVRITDIFTTLLKWTGADVPNDRTIDGMDQRAFLEGKEEKSAREGFPYRMGSTLHGVKWQNFKMRRYFQRNSLEPSQKLASPRIINLAVDPKERNPVDSPYIHS
jgi:arylsulfatase